MSSDKVFAYISCEGEGVKDGHLNLLFFPDFDVIYHRLSAMRWRYLHTIRQFFDAETWARICKPFKKPRNRFSAWQAATTTLFVVPARQVT
jgi:hypothetical protein